MTKGALISACGRYRYLLWREVHREGAGQGVCCFCMINPSTADGQDDDQTVRKCVSYARRWGYRWLVVVNLFAFRTRDQGVLRATEMDGVDVVGPDNDAFLRWTFDAAGVVVCGWGHDEVEPGRALRVRIMAGPKYRWLKLNKNRQPAHPLFLRDDLVPTKGEPVSL